MRAAPAESGAGGRSIARGFEGALMIGRLLFMFARCRSQADYDAMRLDAGSSTALAELRSIARVSTTDPDLTVQTAALTTRAGRAELSALLDFLRKGDTLMVTRIDRLPRSIGDPQDIVPVLKANGVALKATE